MTAIKDQFKPATSSQYIWSSKKQKSVFDRMKANGEIENTLLHGDPGTGKSSFVDMLCQELGVGDEHGNLIRIKTRSKAQNGDDQVQELERATSTWLGCLGGHRKGVIYIDEIDQLKPNAQKWLKSNMEPLSKLFVFVATTNDINDVLPAVQGRFTYKLEIKHSQDQLITLMAKTILKQLEWPYKEADLVNLVKRNRGNVREIYNDMDMEFRP